MSLKVSALLPLLLFLVSGCATQAPEDNAPADANIVENIPQKPPAETLPAAEPSGDGVPPETVKMTSDFVCRNPVILEKLRPLFNGDLYIGQLAGLGAGRGVFTCNLIVDNQAVMQLELRQQRDLFEALYFISDQERIYMYNVKDFEKKRESITENSFSYYSPGTGETRIVFIDTDSEKPVVVKLKTLAPYHSEREKLFEAARALEELI